ncbi:MAG TPA: PmoA family protein [bacterium]|nr:PmoA family protein [bacterium]HPN45705.1 PmoA family protein [bacterium]
MYSDTLTKPILFPLTSPSGIVVTRGFPLLKVEGESMDHPHHTGLFFTYDEVNGSGFWNNTTYPPQIRLEKIVKMQGGDTGTLSVILRWYDHNNQPLLQEDRTMLFSAHKNAYNLDFSATLTALDTTVVFTDTKEGMFAIRVAEWLKEQDTGSRYRSSTGKETEKDIWGTRAEWVTLQGKKDNQTVGIAIFNHPQSVNYPTWWHARAYGLFSANPLGQAVFQKGRGEEEPAPYNLTLEPGKSALFRFLVYIYEGPRSNEELQEQFNAFAGK